MPLNKPNRRMVLAGAAAALLPLRAMAVTESEASAYVQTVINDVFGIINSGQSEAQILRRFKRVFTSYADIGNIAQRVLGAPYRGLTSRQKRDFSNAFGNYLSNKYGRQFREFEGAEITIVRARDAGRAGILVESLVRQRGQSPYKLEWQISDGSGQVKLVDLIIEGIQLISSEREEVRSMLESRRGDIGALTSYMASL